MAAEKQPGGEAWRQPLTCPGINRDLHRLQASSPESAGVGSLCGSVAAAADVGTSSQVRVLKEAVVVVVLGVGVVVAGVDGDADIKGRLHL